MFLFIFDSAELGVVLRPAVVAVVFSFHLGGLYHWWLRLDVCIIHLIGWRLDKQPVLATLGLLDFFFGTRTKEGCYPKGGS